MSTLAIFEQIDPAPSPRLKFRILETYVCIDGHRTRICEGGWTTLEEAQKVLKEKEVLNARD